MDVFETIITTSIDDALVFLKKGDCVGMPTESVYGLAADAQNQDAVLKIFNAKGRPSFNPLIIHVLDIQMAHEWGVFNHTARQLANTFWQGDHSSSLTLVVPLRDDKRHLLAPAVSAGLSTVGIRVPMHPLAKKLISAFGEPLAAPSANKSLYISPTTAHAVYDDLNGLIPLILDGGSCTGGIESTIIESVTESPRMLRQGLITKEKINGLCGYNVDLVNHTTMKNTDTPILAPGMMKKHYSPKKPLRLNATTANKGEAFVGFGSMAESFQSDWNLSPSGDLNEAAFNLYTILRTIDGSSSYHSIAIAPIPHHGVGIALNDRLMRAAAIEHKNY